MARRMRLSAFAALATAAATVTTLAGAQAAQAGPVWTPKDADELRALVRCVVLLDDEATRRAGRLPQGPDWTLLHQSLWRVRSDLETLNGALEALMDQDAREASAEALMPGGPAAAAPQARILASRRCRPLVDAVRAAQGAPAPGALAQGALAQGALAQGALSPGAGAARAASAAER